MSEQPSWDVVIIGAGVIGLALALELKRQGATVLVVERTEPGREASHAAAGMIAYLDPVTQKELLPLARVSAKKYPEFVRQLEDFSGAKVDYRRDGAIELSYQPLEPSTVDGVEVRELTHEELAQLEPKVRFRSHSYLAQEDCLDPRTLVAALMSALRTSTVNLVTGSPVLEVTHEHGRATGVRTERAHYRGEVVVNCAGAWAAQIAPVEIPTVPARGHMLSVVPPHPQPPTEVTPPEQPGPPLRHVVRTPDCYMVPRSDGRLVIGSTLEPAGFDKTVDPRRIQRLRAAAERFVPAISEMQLHEAWTGLRPGTPDGLPILGETKLHGYYACTGHYRDGILLTPVTAQVMSELIRTGRSSADLSRFSPHRFGG
ncbi:MAG TPA: glycine oxidase ThiO [candidate division Zixibacteria bacterium]|nr:glycine oxidase ThiO [candidate division Zixibacteria bacterium]